MRDETGQIELIWFQGAKWIAQSLKTQTPYLAYGKIQAFRGHFNIAHPELQIIGLDIQLSQLGLTPVYPLTEGLKRKKVENKLLAKLSKQIVEDFDFNLVENLPPNHYTKI